MDIYKQLFENTPLYEMDLSTGALKKIEPEIIIKENIITSEVIDITKIFLEINYPGEANIVHNMIESKTNQQKIIDYISKKIGPENMIKIYTNASRIMYEQMRITPIYEKPEEMPEIPMNIMQKYIILANYMNQNKQSLKK